MENISLEGFAAGSGRHLMNHEQKKSIKENVESQEQQRNLKERKYVCIGGNERKKEMDIFRDFLSEGKTGLNFNLKRERIFKAVTHNCNYKTE